MIVNLALVSSLLAIVAASCSPSTVVLVPPREQASTSYPEAAGWSAASEKSMFFQAPIGDDYLMGRDTTMTYKGHASGTIRSTSKDLYHWQALTQTIRANTYRGKRIRLNGFLKSDKVLGGAGRCMRVDGIDRPINEDNMETRPIRGSADWRPYSVVLDVPNDAVAIVYGPFLGGTGQVWASDLNLEVVNPAKVPATGGWLGPDYSKDPAKPRDLDFAALAGSKRVDLPGWTTTSGSWDDVHRDPKVTRNGKPTVVMHVGPNGNNQISLFQEILAAPYRGKRVALQAYLKLSSDTPGGPSIAVPGGGQWVVGKASKFVERGTKWYEDTREWKPVSAVIDVPKWANCLQIGVDLDGPGTIWVSEPSFKVVPKTVPLTRDGPENLYLNDDLKALRSAPVNLSFAK